MGPNALLIVDGLLTLIEDLVSGSAILLKARAEGRDVTEAERDAALAEMDASKARRIAATTRARGGQL